MFKNYLMDSEEFGRLMNPYKSKIKKIVFEKSSYLKKDGYLRKIKKYLRYIGDSYMDISFKTNKSVWAYIDEENTLHIMSTRMLHATSVNRLFVDFENVESISFNNSFRTNEIKSFDEMFKNCKRLTYIDFSGIKTDNAESFCGMFVGCESIEELCLNTFRTESVKSMENMFYRCLKLKKLDVSTFNTAMVFNFSKMFFKCKELEKLDLSCFNVEAGRYFSDMFNSCKNLVDLNISNFDIGAAVYLGRMFYGCNKLPSINMRCLSLANCKGAKCMFQGCEKLKLIKFQQIKADKLLDASFMFCGCLSLKEVDVSFILPESLEKTSCLAIIDIEQMFCGCYRLEKIIFPSNGYWNIKYCTNAFYGCRSLKYLDLSCFDVSHVGDFSNMFANCNNLISLCIGSDYNYTEGIVIENMFKNCFSLRYVSFQFLNGGTVLEFYNFLYGCNNLKAVDLSVFNIDSDSPDFLRLEEKMFSVYKYLQLVYYIVDEGNSRVYIK